MRASLLENLSSEVKLRDSTRELIFAHNEAEDVNLAMLPARLP